MTALAAAIAGPPSDRYPLAILGVGLTLIAGLPGSWTVCIVWRMLVRGMGFFHSPNLRASMSSAPPERGGGGSGIVATSRLVGQAIGAALVGFASEFRCGTVSPRAGLLAGGRAVSFSRLAAKRA